MHLLDFSDDVLNLIFEQVDLITLLNSVRSTSRCLRTLADVILNQTVVKYNVLCMYLCATALGRTPGIRIANGDSTYTPEMPVLWQDEVHTSPLHDETRDVANDDWKISKLVIQPPPEDISPISNHEKSNNYVEFQSNTTNETRILEFSHFALRKPLVSDCTPAGPKLHLRGVLCNDSHSSWMTQSVQGLVSDLKSDESPAVPFLRAADLMCLTGTEWSVRSTIHRKTGTAWFDNTEAYCKTAHVSLTIESLKSLLPSIQLFERQIIKRLWWLLDWTIEELVGYEPGPSAYSFDFSFQDNVSDVYDGLRALLDVWSALRGTKMTSDRSHHQNDDSLQNTPETRRLRVPALGIDLIEALYDFVDPLACLLEYFPMASHSIFDYMSRNHHSC